MTNRERAETRANEIDQQIIDTLSRGESFRVEAGAGAGKTFSLMRVIDWLEKEKRKDFQKSGQRVACLTYTNAAVDEIVSRLNTEGFIQPCTIHNFAWSCMKGFQSSLIKAVEDLQLLPDNEEKTGKVPASEVKKVAYELGVRYVEDGILYLHHDDVISLFAKFLDNAKFRFLLSKQYPIILIDEYQDSFQSIMDQFLIYFIEPRRRPQIGLFGDAWQTIYADNGACGEVSSDNLKVIKKEANFRSEEIIVDVLNKLRPDLPQISASDEHEGRIIVITTDDYCGPRQKGYYKDELPNEILFSYLHDVREKLKSLGWTEDSKTLMLTHKLLAKAQQYENLLSILGAHLKDADDDHYLFFMNRVEPVFSALVDNDPKRLFEALGVERKPIQSLNHKKAWKALKEQLEIARAHKIIDVLKTVQASRLVGLPPRIEDTLNAFLSGEQGLEYHHKPIELFYDIDYSEVIHAIEFQKPDAEFSTDHGVKGTEYNNVLLVLGRGWNNYRFDELLYQDPKKLDAKDRTAFVRNRNLFYVCCSRPKKRLAVLITVPINGQFKDYLKYVFGAGNVMSYGRFLRLEQ